MVKNVNSLTSWLSKIYKVYFLLDNEDLLSLGIEIMIEFNYSVGVYAMWLN